MNRSIAIVILAAGLAAAPTWAQGRNQPPRPPREQPRQQQPRDEAPLRGPEVRQNRPAQLEDRFGGGGRGAMDGRGMPLREFQRIVQQLGEEGAPAELRLSEEQKKRIEGIQQEYRRSLAAQQQRRRQEGQAPEGRPQRPEGQQGERRRPQQGRPQEGDMMGPRGDAGLRPQDVQTRVWAVLTKPQQKHVEQEMEKVRKAQETQRMEQYMQRRMAEREPGREGQVDAPGRTGQPAGAAEGRPAPERLRRIAERMRELTPEQREEVLKKMEAELDRMEAAKR